MDLQDQVPKTKSVAEDLNGGLEEEEGQLRQRSSSLKKSAWFDSFVPSFKEDSYFVSDLRDSERKALQEFKLKIESAIAASEFSVEHSSEVAGHEKVKPLKLRDEKGADSKDESTISIWGIPLLPSKGDERTDVILLKFLRAREFRVNDAFVMLKNCLAWRKSFGADSILEEDLKFDENLDSVAYMHCYDRDGHPVCYNAYGIFRDKVLYEKIFGDDEKIKRFLRWRVQVLEEGIRLLDFRPGGINALIQITDLMNMPKSQLRAVSNQILALFQDNYPEMVARKVFINVPWYFSAVYTMISPFLTPRTKSKFVIASEGKVAETLYKFIPPENIPFQYGGLSRPKDSEFGPNKLASEFFIRAGEKINLEIEGVEVGSKVVWDIIVGGWNVNYRAEFVPSSQRSYAILIDKGRKVSASEEPICSSFQASEAGKVVLIIDNSLSRRRKVAAYRYKMTKSSAE
eukprot:TRINITY_DN23113_c0_g1_i1.p1 TRINITY_DN23113_c0_g1~~TRINITY_DN23113_c0_g1_i1.p1  ORF type:complete len:459 (+),score=95.18 TRINITY_DN23113_c0_g1_i1:429-1805(+)